MITVFNIRRFILKCPYNEWPPEMVYIGRANKWLGLPASKWANPHVLKRETDRGSCLENYRRYIMNCPDMLSQLHELDDKILACYCSPRRCHGDILKELRQLQIEGKL